MPKNHPQMQSNEAVWPRHGLLFWAGYIAQKFQVDLMCCDVLYGFLWSLPVPKSSKTTVQAPKPKFGAVACGLVQMFRILYVWCWSRSSSGLVHELWNCKVSVCLGAATKQPPNAKASGHFRVQPMIRCWVTGARSMELFENLFCHFVGQFLSNLTKLEDWWRAEFARIHVSSHVITLWTIVLM